MQVKHMNQPPLRTDQAKERSPTCRIAAISFFRSAITRCCFSNAAFEAATALIHCSCVRWLASSARMACSSMASGVHSCVQKPPMRCIQIASHIRHAPARGVRHPVLQIAGACAACAGSSDGSCLPSHLFDVTEVYIAIHFHVSAKKGYVFIQLEKSEFEFCFS